MSASVYRKFNENTPHTQFPLRPRCNCISPLLKISWAGYVLCGRSRFNIFYIAEYEVAPSKQFYRKVWVITKYQKWILSQNTRDTVKMSSVSDINQKLKAISLVRFSVNVVLLWYWSVLEDSTVFLFLHPNPFVDSQSIWNLFVCTGFPNSINYSLFKLLSGAICVIFLTITFFLV